MGKRPNSSNNLIKSIKKREWREVHLYLSEADMSDNENTFSLHEICKN